MRRSCGRSTLSPVTDRGGHLVVKALLTLQAGFGLLGTLGMVVIMGLDLRYALLPGLHSVVLLVLAGFVGRRRGWALTATIVLEGFALAGWLVQVLLGLLPQIDFTVNVVGLLTMLGLPVVVVVLCAICLAGIDPGARRRPHATAVTVR